MVYKKGLNMITLQELKELINDAIDLGYKDCKVGCTFYDKNKRDFDIQPISGADIVFNKELEEIILELY
jgi:hypothetical protein